MIITSTVLALALHLQSPMETSSATATATASASSLSFETASVTVEELESRSYHYPERLHYDGTTGYVNYDFEFTNHSDTDKRIDRSVTVCVTNGELHMEEVPGVLPVYETIPAGESVVVTMGCETSDPDGDVQYPW